MTPRSSELLKITTGCLAGAIITGLSAWLVLGQNVVTRPEMRSYVEGHSPWVRDRGTVTTQITSLDRAIGSLAPKVEQILLEQRTIITKLDALKRN